MKQTLATLQHDTIVRYRMTRPPWEPFCYSLRAGLMDRFLAACTALGLSHDEACAAWAEVKRTADNLE